MVRKEQSSIIHSSEEIQSPQQPAHLCDRTRPCFFRGTFARFLLALVASDVFRAPYRMRDRELLLRYFALRTTGVQGFMLPVKTWLNEQMRQ